MRRRRRILALLVLLGCGVIAFGFIDRAVRLEGRVAHPWAGWGAVEAIGVAILVEAAIVLTVAARAQGARTLPWWFLVVAGTNLATIPLFNATLVGLYPDAPPEPSGLLGLEAAVVGVEATVYAVGGRLGLFRALLTSLAGNAASLLIASGSWLPLSHY